MNHRSRRLAAVLPLVTALLAPPIAGAAGDETLGRRDLRAARAAIEERRWQQGLDLYERILDSKLATDPDVRREALYAAALLQIASPEQPGLVEAHRHLTRLEAMPSADVPLERAALGKLLDRLIAAETKTAELEKTSRREREEAALELRQTQLASAEEMAALESALASQRSRNRVLRRSNRGLVASRDTLAQRLEDSMIELAQRKADVDFLVGQLEGSQQDQHKMLNAVMKKNDELEIKERQLRSTRLALQQREVDLETQAAELASQAEELEKREAAIRKVTERVLEKENPDS